MTRMKATTSFNLSSLRPLCKTMEGLIETIDIHRETKHKSTKGKVEAELICLEKQLRKAMKGCGSSSQRGMHHMHRIRKGTLALDGPRKKISSQDEVLQASGNDLPVQVVDDDKDDDEEEDEDEDEDEDEEGANEVAEEDEEVNSVPSEDTNLPMSRKKKASEDTNPPMPKKRKTESGRGPLSESEVMRRSLSEAEVMRRSLSESEVMRMSGFPSEILKHMDELYMKGRALASEIPKDLFMLITRALAIRKYLKTNMGDRASKKRLSISEGSIRATARLYKMSNLLPRNWKYDPTTIGGFFA